MSKMWKALLVVLTFISFGESANVTDCWKQKCLECDSASQFKPKEQVKCDTENQVNLSWLNARNKPFTENSTNGMGFACIKMVANRKNSTGDSTDVISGCVRANIANKMCDDLKEEENIRGKNATCITCTDNYCNRGLQMSISVGLLFISNFLVKIFNY